MRRYLKILIDFVRRDLRSQYSGSALGVAWIFIGPLLQIVIYTVVFGLVFKARPMMNGTEVPYLLYLCAALIPWNMFSLSITRSIGSLIDHAPYIKKLSLPNHIYISYVLVSGIVPFTLLFTAYLALYLGMMGNIPIGGIAIYLAFYFLLLVFMLGVSLLFAPINVFYRDVAQGLPFILQLLFWATPIVYPSSAIPEWGLKFLNMNPLAVYVSGFRGSTFMAKADISHDLMLASCFSFVSLGLGLLAYRSMTKWVVDEL